MMNRIGCALEKQARFLRDASEVCLNGAVMSELVERGVVLAVCSLLTVEKLLPMTEDELGANCCRQGQR